MFLTINLGIDFLFCFFYFPISLFNCTDSVGFLFLNLLFLHHPMIIKRKVLLLIT